MSIVGTCVAQSGNRKLNSANYGFFDQYFLNHDTCYACFETIKKIEETYFFLVKSLQLFHNSPNFTPTLTVMLSHDDQETL